MSKDLRRSLVVFMGKEDTKSDEPSSLHPLSQEKEGEKVYSSLFLRISFTRNGLEISRPKGNKTQMLILRINSRRREEGSSLFVSAQLFRSGKDRP